MSLCGEGPRDTAIPHRVKTGERAPARAPVKDSFIPSLTVDTPPPLTYLPLRTHVRVNSRQSLKRVRRSRVGTEMHKDPLEREREFRRTLERDASARRAVRLRRARPWPAWLKPLANLFFRRLGLSLLLAALLAFGGLFVYVFGLHVKGANAYACSLAEARRSPAVIAELGVPVEAGFF